MNTQDQLERMLTSELHDRADGLGGAGFGFADVKGRATKIRRNRRIAAGAGIAAALAIVVPTAMTAGGTLKGDRTPDPANPSPTTSQVEVHRTTLTLDGLTRGDAPGVTFLTPDGTVFPGQEPRDLGYNYNAVVPSAADGGYLAWEGAALDVRYLSESFEQQGGSLTNSTFVSNPDQSQVAWVFPEGGAQTLVDHSTVDPEDTRTWDFPASPLVEVVDFAGDHTLVYEEMDGQGGVDSVWLAIDGGEKVRFSGDFVKAISANQTSGLVAVQTQALKDGRGCFGVLDSREDLKTPLWETCNNSLGAFSPDGRYVLASDPYQSGLGPVSISVLDAQTGALVTTFTQASDTQIALVGVVWESNEAFLSAAVGGETWTALRFGVDGSLEEAIEPFQGDAFDVPFVFNRDQVRGY